MKERSHLSSFQNEQLLVSFLLAFLVLASLLSNLKVLFEYDVPLGVDGYYYILQIESFLTNGSFYYSTCSPLVLYLAAGLSILGVEPIFAMKILGPLLYAGLITIVYLIIADTTKNRWAGLFGAFLVAVSVLRLIWVVEFVNNLGGIVFLLCALYCLLKKPKGKVWVVAGISFLILALLCHRSILPLCFSLLLAIGIFHGLIKTSGFTCLSVIAVLLVFGVLFHQYFLVIAPLSNFSQFVSDILADHPKFPLFVDSFFEEKFVLVILAPTSLLISLKLATRDRRLAYANGAIAIFTLLVTLNPMLKHTGSIVTVADRLELLMQVQIALMFAFTMRLTLLEFKSEILAAGAILILVLIGNRGLIGNYGLYKGNDKAYLEKRVNLVKNLRDFKQVFPSESVVVAPHGYQFLLTSILKVPSQRLLPKHKGHIYWLIFDVPCDSLNNKSAIISREQNLCTAIVTTQDIKPIPKEERIQLFDSNPHLARSTDDLKEELVPTLRHEPH